MIPNFFSGISCGLVGNCFINVVLKRISSAGDKWVRGERATHSLTHIYLPFTHSIAHIHLPCVWEGYSSNMCVSTCACADAVRERLKYQASLICAREARMWSYVLCVVRVQMFVHLCARVWVPLMSCVCANVCNPSTIWIENVALSRIGVVIVGARKFSENLQSSKISKTNDQQFFFDPCPNLELVPNELSRNFRRTKNWDTSSGQAMIAFFTA